MNVLVTGGAGFIGSFLIEELLKSPNKVICVDNFFRGTRTNLMSANKKQNYELLELDLTKEYSKEIIKKIILKNNIKAIFHLAAINGTEYFYDASLKVLNDNILMTQNLLEGIVDTKIEYLMYASSSEVYGDPFILPTDENQKIVLNAFADRDSYASSKAIGEYYFRLSGEKLKIPTTIVRFFNQYGPRMVNSKYGQVVAEFITRCKNEDKFTIIGDGTQTRSFCYVEDAISILKKLYEIKYNGIINVGNDDEITINKLAYCVHQMFGRKFEPKYLEARKNDHSRRCPDIKLLKEIIPDIKFLELEEGLKITANYYN